jgi:hypothetical protein
MLEQAIVDAKALKEAALKNAEQAVIDKYSTEIKAAVEELLEGNESEQTINEEMEIPYASDPSLADEEPVEMEMEFEFNPEDFRLDLESIKTQAEADPESGGEQPQDTPSLASDIGLTDEQPAAPVEDLGGEGLGGLLQESELDKEDQLVNELLSLLEDDEDILDEALTVDMEEVKHGHFVTDNGARKYDAEKELAAQQSSEYKEKADELEKEVGELKNSVLMYQDRQTKIHSVLDDMKGKLEEMILQNARLIYSNKVLSDTSLNERQKSKIVEAIASAETLKEAKTLYKTLKETTVGTRKERGPKSLSESVQRKQVLSAHLPRRKQEKSTEQHDFASRMKKLAGLD